MFDEVDKYSLTWEGQGLNVVGRGGCLITASLQRNIKQKPEWYGSWMRQWFIVGIERQSNNIMLKWGYVGAEHELHTPTYRLGIPLKTKTELFQQSSCSYILVSHNRTKQKLVYALKSFRAPVDIIFILNILRFIYSKFSTVKVHVKMLTKILAFWKHAVSYGISLFMEQQVKYWAIFNKICWICFFLLVIGFILVWKSAQLLRCDLFERCAAGHCKICLTI